MPELPEVETVRRALSHALLNRKIREVRAPRDPLIYAGQVSGEFSKALSGAKVLGSGRRGKYFWLELDRRPWPVFHLGMTGNLHLYEERSASAPRFCRLELVTDRGQVAAFSDPRRFSRVWLAQAPWAHPAIARLGPDPLGEFTLADELFEILHRRKAPIKAVLLDQKVFAGVGNWVADEILFQARLDPRRACSDLTRTEVRRIREVLLRVLRKAVSVSADDRRFPRSWLFHHRWGKRAEAKTSRGDRISYQTIGGRTTAWVPAVQV